MVFIASAESPIFALGIIREIVIDYNYFWLSMDEKIQCITPGIINFLCQKYVFDSVWIFSERWKRGQEIAITALSLPYVIWWDILENSVTASTINIDWSLPLVTFPNLFLSFLWTCRIYDWRSHWLEKWVLPWLVCLDDSLVIDFL